MPKPLREISRDIVTSTWREVEHYNSSTLARLTERLEQSQPHVMPFVLSTTQDAGPAVQQLAVYLTHLLFRMEEKVKGEAMGKIPEATLVELYRGNRSWLDEREFVNRLIDESIKKGEKLCQPQLLDYLVQALFEEIEGGVVLTLEKKRRLFLVLKTVVDGYEAAMQAR